MVERVERAVLVAVALELLEQQALVLEALPHLGKVTLVVVQLLLVEEVVAVAVLELVEVTQAVEVVQTLVMVLHHLYLAHL
jgi:hypothetical protein